MTPKVSILIPVYNVSPYMERCAHSLFKQTFKDIEYIFVDDASPDDSMEILHAILEQYPDRKEMVKVMRHPVNRGLAAARNTAIDASSGEYILVVDSDDYIEPDMVEVLYKQAKEKNAGIVVSDIIMEYPDKSVVLSDFVADSQEKNIYNMLVNEISYSYLWNKLVRRELYEQEDCRVPEGLNYLEDRHVMTRLYYYANKIVKVNRAFYHYVRYNLNSITKTKNRMHFENTILFWQLLDDFLIEKGIYEQYREELEFSKIQNKCRVMSDTSSYSLRKKYADILSNKEKKYLNRFKRGEKLMLFFIHYRLFVPAHLLHKLSWYKNKKRHKSFPQSH